jgi:hypothetical protein
MLTLLRDRAALTPKPPDDELAHAHVPPADVGLPDPIEDWVVAAMRSEDDRALSVYVPVGQNSLSR